jgi:hypothetical protein
MQLLLVCCGALMAAVAVFGEGAAWGVCVWGGC